MVLEFWFDIVCPYAYLASTQVEAHALRAGAKLVWRPTLLGGVYKGHRGPNHPLQDASAARTAFDMADRLRQADQLGVPLLANPHHPVRSVNAMRLVLAAGDQTAAVAHALFHAYHVDHLDIANDIVLDNIATRFGIGLERRKQADIKQALFDAVEGTVDKGIFGVPSFSVDGGPFIWGTDQLHFVEEALGLPREPVPAPTVTHSTLSFFHDFSSPYSYLAATQIEGLALRNGVTIEWVPILLGGLFRAIGTPDVPLNTYHAAKLRWNMSNLAMWADWHDVPFSFPSQFPIRSVLPLRVALVNPKTTMPIYRAAWSANVNIGEPRALAACLDASGFDGKALVAQAAEPAPKQQLRANTERAQGIGACGVPSFLVNDTHLFWGQDRLNMVEAALRGWQAALLR